MRLSRTWFGKDFNPSITQPVKLRRKWILIDTDFANRGLWRNMAAAETVYIKLFPVWARRRACQGLQLILQFVGVVGQSLRSLPLRTIAFAFFSGSVSTIGGICVYLYVLLINLDL